MSDESLGPQLSSRVRMHDWFAMTDRDRAVAVHWAWLRHQHPDKPAPPVHYVDAPELCALTPEEAAHHAQHVTGGWQELEERLDQDERDRLYRLGLDLAENRRPGT
jgi:hypothetical protein